MRSGGCAVQQALAPDAAAVMVQAVSAARRRGHAQVTPLHVASALLAAGEGGVLRAACLRSRPAGAAHPLRCKALEMCLNVALNRLATTPIAAGGAPAHHAALFGFQHQHHNVPPALSNALAAAFKRAQASQRRGGSSEQQAAAAASNSNKKVELEQLVISILDDPSVNRVLRDAGFCSAEVKAHVALVDKPAAAAVSSSSPDHNSSSNTATTTTSSASPAPPNLGSNTESDPSIKAKTNKPDDELSRGNREEKTTAWRAAGQPSAILGMHPVGGGLALSPSGDSELTYGATNMVTAAPARSVPSWYRHCHGPSPALSRSELALSFSSPPPAAATCSIYGYGFPHYDHDQNCLLDPRQPWHINHRHDINAPIMADSHDHHPWPGSPNPGGSSNSVSISSSSGNGANAGRPTKRFTELTAENLRVMCSALDARVPRQRDLAPGIASAVLRRRSGVTARTAARPTSSAATWLVFEGGDTDGKATVARELARLVFGSYHNFTTIEPARSAGSSSGGGGGGELSLKRRRSSLLEKEELLGYLMQRLHEAVRENPHRVFLIDGVIARSEEEAGIVMNAITTGTVRGYNNGDVASLEDAIVVLICEAFHQSCWSRAPSSRTRLKKKRDDDIVSSKVDDDDAQKAAKRPRFSLDLNACAVDGGDELDEGSSSSLDSGAEILNNAVDGVFLFQC